MRHPIEQPTHIQASMTLPTQPHAIFSIPMAIGTRHTNPDTKPTLQRAKKANAHPTHPGSRISIILIIDISKTTTINTSRYFTTSYEKRLWVSIFQAI